MTESDIEGFLSVAFAFSGNVAVRIVFASSLQRFFHFRDDHVRTMLLGISNNFEGPRILTGIQLARGVICNPRGVMFHTTEAVLTSRPTDLTSSVLQPAVPSIVNGFNGSASLIA